MGKLGSGWHLSVWCPLFAQYMMKSERSGWASLSQANAGPSSSNLPKGGASCPPQPCQAGGLVLCPCINLPRAPSVSSLNLLPGRAHLFCILSMFSISNYLCHFFTPWKHCYGCSECGSVRVAGNWLDGFMPAGSHENSRVGGNSFVRHWLLLVSLVLLPFQRSHICPLPVPPWVLLSPVPPHFSKMVSLAFSSASPLPSGQPQKTVWGSKKELSSTCGMLQMRKWKSESGVACSTKETRPIGM